MIQWFVTQGHVRKRIWRPEGARMARIAFLSRDEMSCVHACGRDAVVTT